MQAPLPDIITLRQFYSSPLGKQVKKTLRQAVLARVSRARGETMVGLGYSVPLLRAIEESALNPQTLIALMPAAQGAIYWPVEGDNRAALVDENNLPLQTNIVHWLLALHALENVDEPARMLQEAWRILVPGGRMLLLVPQRKRPWRWWGATPFAGGRAYNKNELYKLLREAEFTIAQCQKLLIAPPFKHPLLLRLWPVCEWLGSILFPGLGSLMLIEVEKQIYAAIKQPVSTVRRRLNVGKIATAVSHRLFMPRHKG